MVRLVNEMQLLLFNSRLTVQKSLPVVCLISAWMWLTVAEAIAENQLEPKHVLISSTGSERATSGAGNKIVTFGGKTHVVWQDVTSEGYFNRVGSLDHATGRWSEPFTLNKGRDNHARPVLTVDGRGYLHAILSGHNSGCSTP